MTQKGETAECARAPDTWPPAPELTINGRRRAYHRTPTGARHWHRPGICVARALEATKSPKSPALLHWTSPPCSLWTSNAWPISRRSHSQPLAAASPLLKSSPCEPPRFSWPSPKSKAKSPDERGARQCSLHALLGRSFEPSALVRCRVDCRIALLVPATSGVAHLLNPRSFDDYPAPFSCSLSVCSIRRRMRAIGAL